MSRLSTDFLKGGLANLALPVTAVVAGPLLARGLSVSDRGTFAAVLSGLSLTTYILGLGIGEASAFFTAGEQAPVASVRRFHLVTSAVAGTLLAVGTAVYLAHARTPASTVLILTGLAFYTPVQAVRYQEALGLRRYNRILIARWAQAVARLVGFSVFVALGQLTAITALATHLAAQALASIPLLLRHTRVSSRPINRTAVLRVGIPQWLGGLMTVVILRVDQLAIAAFSGRRELALYAVAASLAELPLLATGAVRPALTAAIASDRAVAHRVCGYCQKAVVILLAMAFVGILLMPLVLPFMMGASYNAAVPCAQVLLVATVFSALNEVAGAAFMGIGQPRKQLPALLWALSVTLVGIPALVPIFGAMGAAWLSLLTYAVAALVSIRELARTQGLAPLDYIAFWRLRGTSRN